MQTNTSTQALPFGRETFNVKEEGLRARRKVGEKEEDDKRCPGSTVATVGLHMANGRIKEWERSEEGRYSRSRQGGLLPAADDVGEWVWNPTDGTSSCMLLAHAPLPATELPSSILCSR